MFSRRMTLGLAAGALLAPLSQQAMAVYPDRPVTLIVAWAAGGGTDSVARTSDAATKAHARADVQQPLKDRCITPKWEKPEEFAAFAKKYTETSSGLLKDLGLAKN